MRSSVGTVKFPNASRMAGAIVVLYVAPLLFLIGIWYHFGFPV